MFKNLLDLDHRQAEIFFYRNESFYDGELPKYFNFTKLLWGIRDAYNVDRNSIKVSAAKDYDNVNYEIYTNKDGKYAWRKLQIVNPVLYVDFISYITQAENWEHIKQRIIKLHASCKSNIRCVSIPVVETRRKRNVKSNQILEWWEGMEQGSLKCAVEFLYAYTADISDCYPSIYTHTISWALKNKCIAKKNRNDASVGNTLDKKLQNMQHAQTNGIPQGSIVMALIAEILLAYADRKLFFALKKYKGIEYKIIRYRDDYKIFVNSKKDGEIVIKELTAVLLHLNLKLNSSKTKYFDDAVAASIKTDKYNAIRCEGTFLTTNEQKNLLKVHSFLAEFPNSKQMAKWLSAINDGIMAKLQQDEERISQDSCEVLISICAQIAYKNPSLYAHCCQVLSSLLSVLPDAKSTAIIKLIFGKFSTCPHSSLMNIFLQRIALPYGIEDNFGEKICKIVINSRHGVGRQIDLWDFKWMRAPIRFKRVLESQKFINERTIDNLKKTIHRNAVDIFTDLPY